LKRPISPRSKSPSASTAHIAGADWKKHRRRPKGAPVAIGLLILFHLVLLFMFTLPDRRVPPMIQRLVAVADAALAASIVPLVLNELGKKYESFPWFHGRKGSTGTVGGAIVFALVLSVWFTPLAPIKAVAPADDEPPNRLENSDGDAPVDAGRG